MLKYIKYGNEYWKMYENGMIERPNLVSPSNSWKVTGAVRFNNFGYIVESFSLDDILNGGIIWKYKNGKQRVYVCDLDHGSHRIWISPKHSIN